MDLIHLPVRTSAPSLGSHRFVLRSGSRIEEIAILIDDVLYYTLPCIAELVFPVEEILGNSLPEPYAAPTQHHSG